jgi:glycosyltransferase involved in cell wall biosynthesis
MLRPVVQIAHYPCKPAIGGGQRRIAHIARALRRRDEHHRFLPVHLYSNEKSAHYSSANGVPISRFQSDWVAYPRADFEIRLGEAMRNTNTVKTLAEAACEPRGPVLWLEHCYVWWALKPLIGKRRRVPLVYSSHNVEFQMKSAILARGDEATRYYLPQLIENEHDLARSADIVIACSAEDAAYWRTVGAREVVLIPNAADQPRLDPTVVTVHHLERLLSCRFGEDLVITFISSDHEPNWLGVRDLLLPAMALLHRSVPTVRLVMMGSICRRLKGTTEPWLRTMPFVEDAEKDAILQLADLVVLPITAGGGTNLKTAEALLTTQPVVGATVGFRGYEFSQRMGHVRTADTPVEFFERMNELLTATNRGQSPLVRTLARIANEPDAIEAFNVGTWSAWYNDIGDVYTRLAS